MRELIIRNRKINIEENYATFFETYICSPLEDMADIYLCAEFQTNDIEEKLALLSNEEIVAIIRAWADAEFEVMGVKYGDTF